VTDAGAIAPERLGLTDATSKGFQLWRLGGCNPGFATALDVAGWAGFACVASYFASMLVVAAKMRPFAGKSGSSGRLRTLCWTPYFTEGILAGIGGLFNPLGLFYVIASAVPSTLGANAGMLSLPSMMRMWSSEERQVEPVQRSAAWIGTSAVASLLFILVLGRGVTWSRISR
jgi:hypothetical protein